MSNEYKEWIKDAAVDKLLERGNLIDTVTNIVSIGPARCFVEGRYKGARVAFEVWLDEEWQIERRELP